MCGGRKNGPRRREAIPPSRPREGRQSIIAHPGAYGRIWTGVGTERSVTGDNADMYPTDEYLERIERWDVIDGDPWKLVAFVSSLWRNAGWGWRQEERGGQLVLDISTGGWSGNEGLIVAMQRNYIFWSCSWLSSRAGGHYHLVVQRRTSEGGILHASDRV